jgi:hypothetical protein
MSAAKSDMDQIIIASNDADLYLNLAYVLYKNPSLDDPGWQKLQNVYHIENKQQIYDDHFLLIIKEIDTDRLKELNIAAQLRYNLQ